MKTLDETLALLTSGPRDHFRRTQLVWLSSDSAAFDAFPELEDVADELDGYIPLADVNERCMMVAREAPHRVVLFDDGFREIAPSLEQFEASLRRADEPTSTVVTAGQAGGAATDQQLLTAALAAGDLSDARSRVETLLGSFKAPGELNDLRITYARVLVAQGDVQAATALATEHRGYIQWLATSDRGQAESLRSAFVAAVDMMGRVGDVVTALRDPLVAPLTVPTPAEGPTVEDIATALRLVRQTKVLPLRNLLEKMPTLRDNAEVRAELPSLDSSPRAASVRQLFE